MSGFVTEGNRPHPRRMLREAVSSETTLYLSTSDAMAGLILYFVGRESLWPHALAGAGFALESREQPRESRPTPHRMIPWRACGLRDSDSD